MIFRVAYALPKVKLTNEFPSSENGDIFFRHLRMSQMKVAMGRTDIKIATWFTLLLIQELF